MYDMKHMYSSSEEYSAPDEDFACLVIYTCIHKYTEKLISIN